MFGFLASPSQGDLTDMFGIKSSFWPPPWSLFILAAIVGLACLYCKKHCINIYVLNLSITSSQHNNQEKLKKYKKNNNKNVSISMSEGNGPVSSLLSTKKSRQSFVIGSITALVAAFLVYAGLSNLSFKAQRFNAAVVEVGNIPPSSLPLDLPPPLDIFGEVTVVDKAISLLRGATVQTFLLSPDSKEGEEDLDDGIVRVGTPEVASGSDDSLSSFKSGFHRVGFKGYDQMPFELSGRVRTLFQSLGQLDGGPSSSAFFSMASLGSTAVGFLSGSTSVQDIFEKSVEDATTVSESISDEFATQTETRVNGFVGNMDVAELKCNTSNNYGSCTCPADVHLRYKCPVDKDGDVQHLGGLTKWINHFLLASSNDNRDGSCMKVSEASGDWPYSPDKSTNSYQDGAVYSLLKKSSNPTTLGGLEVESASNKANLLDVFSNKCVRSNEVSLPASFIKDRTVSLLSEASTQRYIDLQQHQQEVDDDSLHVQLPVEGASSSFPNDLVLLFKSGFQLELKGCDSMPFDSELGHSGLSMAEVSSSPIGLDESMKIWQHKSSLPWWYLRLTMMVTLILGAALVNGRSSPASIPLPSLANIPKLFHGILSFISSAADMNSRSSRLPIGSPAPEKKARRMISLLSLAVILSSPANALELDLSAGDSNQKDPHSIAAVNEESAFGFTEMMKPLSNVERRLRGGSNEPLDTKEAADMFSTLHGSASKYSKMLSTLQEQHKNDDDEGFAATIKALMSDMNQPEFKSLANEAATLTSDSSLSSALDQLDSTQLPDDFSLDSIPASSIINTFNKMVSQDFFGDLADRSNDLRDELSKSKDTLEEYRRRLSEDKFHHDNFDFSFQEDSHDNFDFNGNNFAGFNNKFNRFGGFNLNSHPSLKRFFSPHHSSMTRRMKKKRSFSASRHLKKVFNKAKAAQGSAPRDPNRRSRRLQNDDTCPTVCRPEDQECNCKDLVKYALDMAAYDVLIMLTRGNIDTDETSDDFGHLTGDVNLFTDTEGFVPEKVNYIQSLAASMASSRDYRRCNELLEAFHTVCDPQATTCPANNTQSFQLSIEEVHDSVNAPEKLVFSNITLFDGFETLANPFLQSGFTDEIMAWYRSQSHSGANVAAFWAQGMGLNPNCDPVWLVYDAADLLPRYVTNVHEQIQGLFNYCRNIMIAELSRIEAEWNGNVDFGVLCQSVSYEALSEFGFWFSHLYEGRNKTTHPDGNPMERTPGEPVHDVDPATFNALDRMVFPVAYNFEQTDRGIMHLRDEPARYEFASNLEDFPGTSSRTTGTWQITIDDPTLISNRYESFPPRVYSYTYSQDEGCFSSQGNPELVSRAMNAADESLALLVGKHTSIGTIRRHAALVNDKSIPNASDQLPGTCCLDDPLDSDFLGYYYDPDNEDMNCIDPGPYHLGMSPEACENGGGHWDRSPCHTLKKCIDDRPEPDTSGVCANDISISCRDDSVCPTILGTGTCAGSSQECAGDEDCSGDSTCINRSEDIQLECHYFPGYGNCREDPSIKCRVDSECPLTTSETGTCNRANEKISPQVCLSDSDCQPNSKCEFGEPSLPTECLFTVGPFEDFAQGLVIDDAADLARCEEIREELGYEADHLDDVEVCESFVDLRCNPDGVFEFLEQETEDVPTSIGASPISFTPPDWEPDPPLPFEPLPFEELSSKDLTFVELDRDKFVLHFNVLDPKSEGESSKPPSLPEKTSETYKLKLYGDQLHLDNALNTFKIAKANLESQKELGKALSDFHDNGNNSYCDTLWGNCEKAFGVGIVFCIAGAICHVMAVIVAYLGYFYYHTALVGWMLASITLESMAIGKNNYDEQTHKNQYKSDNWMTASLVSMNNYMHDKYNKMNENMFAQNRMMNDLIFQQNYILNHNINAQHTTITNNMYSQHETIRTNMNNQHTTINTNMINQHEEMRETLQQRHLDIVIEINTYNMCATNHILYETTDALAKAHGPEVINRTPPPSAECRTILELDNRRLAEGNEGEGVNEIMLDISPGYEGVSGELDDIETKENEIIQKEDEIQDTLNNMISAMSDIMKKLDMDPEVLDPKKKKPKTPKKPKHAKASEAQDVEAGDLFERNLLAVEEVNDKFDDMKNQVKSVESKVESIEGKVEKIEQTMEEMKEMLSQLMMRGAADA